MATLIKDLLIFGKHPEQITYENSKGSICVYAWGVYPHSSVLAGQPCKEYKNTFDTVEEAIEAYPEAKASHLLQQPRNTFDHLDGDEDDFNPYDPCLNW